MEENDTKTPSLKAWLKLGFILFCFWFIIWQVTPVLVANIPALAHYGKVAEENDIRPGALYYNDVPVSMEAEQNNRDTVRFLPRGNTN